MSKIRLGVFGPSGRMGQDIVKQITHFDGIELSALCEKENHTSINERINDIRIDSDLKNLIKNSDVIIDFTNPKATLSLLAEIKISDKNTALVTGTTGFSKEDEIKFNELCDGLKVLRSFNMSLGVNMLKTLVNISSKNLSEISDIEILEYHHNRKRDVPSGTALSLFDSIKDGAGSEKNIVYRTEDNDRIRKRNEVGFSSIRGGDVVGEHSVFFFMDGERIELTHKASDRKIFSVGALKASIWLHKKKPGLYSILDMIE